MWYAPRSSCLNNNVIKMHLVEFLRVNLVVRAVLYNGVGGPDNSSAIAATPFFVSLESSGAGKASLPTLVPATPCASMLSNGSCYFLPAPCSSFTDILPNGTHVRSYVLPQCMLRLRISCAQTASLSCK